MEKSNRRCFEALAGFGGMARAGGGEGEDPTAAAAADAGTAEASMRLLSSLLSGPPAPPEEAEELPMRLLGIPPLFSPSFLKLG
jgi:hypothetical protein